MKKYIITILIILTIIILISFLNKNNYDIVFSVDVSDNDFSSIKSFCLSADNKYLIVNAGTFSKSYEEVPFEKTGEFGIQEVSSSTSSLLLYDAEKLKLINENSFFGNSSNNFYSKKRLEDYKTWNFAPDYDKFLPLPDNNIGIYKYEQDYQEGIYFQIHNDSFEALDYNSIKHLLPYPYAENYIILNTENKLYRDSDTLILGNHRYNFKRIRSKSFYADEILYNENGKELLAYTLDNHKSLLISNDFLINIHNNNFMIGKIFLDSIQTIFINSDSISSFLSYKIFPNHFICTYYNTKREQMLFIFKFSDTSKILINANDFRNYDSYTFDYLPKLFFDKNQNYLCLMSDYRIKILDLKDSKILFDRENGYNFNMGFFNKSNKIWVYYKTSEYSYEDEAFRFLIFDIDKGKYYWDDTFDFTDPSLSLDDQYILCADRKSSVFIMRTTSFFSENK